MTFWLIEESLGVWAWLLAVPVAFFCLHLVAIGAVAIAAMCCRIGVLPVERREIFAGLVLAVGMVLAAAILRQPAMLPWLVLACVEAVAWPARRVWEWTEEGG